MEVLENIQKYILENEKSQKNNKKRQKLILFWPRCRLKCGIYLFCGRGGLNGSN